MKARLAILVAVLVVGCGSPPPPAAPAPSSPVAATTDAPTAPPAASSSAPAEGRPPRPLDLANACPKDVHLYYGAQPGDGKGQAATVAAGATVQVPRGDDGEVTVWVTDDAGSGLASVHVKKGMKHVWIDASCARIDAGNTKP
jgi:hypothetical protein